MDGSAVKLTLKQEDFCLAYIETGNATEAYRRAYCAEKMRPAVINVKATEMLRRGKIEVRIAELRKPVVENAQITLKSHLEELAKLREAAKAAEQFSAAITAEVSRGKASGFYVNKTELTGKDGADLSIAVVFGDDDKG